MLPSTTATTGAATDDRYDVSSFSPHLLNLAAGGVWPAGFRNEDAGLKNRKRSHSPSARDGTKVPRMMVLKQGDGPTLGKKIIKFNCTN